MSTRKAAKRADSPELKQARAFMESLRAERGAISRLADQLGLSPQAVHQWSIVPLDRVIEVERATGISRRKVRPDVHNVPSAAR